VDRSKQQILESSCTGLTPGKPGWLLGLSSKMASRAPLPLDSWCSSPNLRPSTCSDIYPHFFVSIPIPTISCQHTMKVSTSILIASTAVLASTIYAHPTLLKRAAGNVADAAGCLGL